MLCTFVRNYCLCSFYLFILCSVLLFGFSEQVPEGLERAIMTMKKTEQALVTINAEYLCNHKNFPENTTNNNKVLYYEIELVDFIKVSKF